jgi:hypothetical protein
MVPSKENKIKLNLEKRANTSMGKKIKNTDSVGGTNLDTSSSSKPSPHIQSLE